MTKPDWAVLSDDEAREIAVFGGIDIDKVRGIEMLVLMKAGRAIVAPRVASQAEEALAARERKALGIR